MSEIPEDVKRTADAAMLSAGKGDWFDIRDIIARAILAERERCAQIAESAPYSETDVAEAIRGKP